MASYRHVECTEHLQPAATTHVAPWPRTPCAKGAVAAAVCCNQTHKEMLLLHFAATKLCCRNQAVPVRSTSSKPGLRPCCALKACVQGPSSSCNSRYSRNSALYAVMIWVLVRDLPCELRPLRHRTLLLLPLPLLGLDVGEEEG